MVGAPKNFDAAQSNGIIIQLQRLTTLRHAQRWVVESSGNRVASRQYGAGLASASAFPRLLAAPVAEVAIRRRPSGQYGECLLAQLTSHPPHPDPIVPLVMSLLAPASVADDCVPAAGRTSARQPAPS